MKILFLITSPGDQYYCGNCVRDDFLASALRESGEDVIVMPLYLPLDQMQTDTEVFFPATSYYVADALFGEKPMPAWLDSFLSRKAFLDLAASLAGSTSAGGMEGMTLSMIKGEGRAFRDRMEGVLEFIEKERPDIIHIPTTMLTGVARLIRERFPIPIVCSVQDEEIWIDELKGGDASRAWQGIRDNARWIDSFVTTSVFYMHKAQSLGMPFAGQMHLLHPGVNLEKYHCPTYPADPTIGFNYRMNSLDGLDTLVDAFIRLKKKDSIPNLRLYIGGGHTSLERKFLSGIRRKLSPYKEWVTFQKGYTQRRHFEFYREVSVVCVPIKFDESIGLYLPEAFAAGRPVVEPDRGSFREITGGAGILYDPSVPEALDEALERIFLSGSLMGELRQKALQRARDTFNSTRLASEIKEVYQNAINSFEIGKSL